MTRRLPPRSSVRQDLWLEIDAHEARQSIGASSACEEDPPDRFAMGTREIEPAHIEDVARNEQIAQLVHDFKNPLSTIALETQLLDGKLARGDLAGSSAILARIDHNVRFLDRMVQELLDSSAIDAHRLALRRLPTELCSLLEDVIERAVATRDRARVFLDASIGTVLSIDDLRIERVVANLISNALKYGPHNAGVVVRLTPGEHHVCISVIDSGSKMTTGDQQTVFDKYYRAEHASAHEGSGLGLYISRKIVEAHGGQIGVECAPGAGTRFFLQLPR